MQLLHITTSRTQVPPPHPSICFIWSTFLFIFDNIKMHSIFGTSEYKKIYSEVYSIIIILLLSFSVIKCRSSLILVGVDILHCPTPYNFGARNLIQGLMCTKHILYHWATTWPQCHSSHIHPSIKMTVTIFLIISPELKFLPFCFI